MAAIPKYVFVIIDSSGNQYEFERATRRAWEYYENDVGRCRFFVPYNDLKLSTTSISDNKLSEIRIYRSGSLVWQGAIQIVQDTVDGTWVYGETYNAFLGWYGVRYNQSYTAIAIGTIITNEYANIISRSSNILSAKITQGTIQSPYITGTASDLTITRTLFHENFLSFLKQMVLASRAEMTTSFAQNTAFNISFSETAPTFTFTRNVGSNKADVVLELGSEIVEFNIPRDMRDITNSVKGLAIGTGPIVLSTTATDTTSQSSWYLREQYPFFNNVTAQNDLNQRTDNFLFERKDTKRDMKIKLAAGLVPFDGYALGDSIKVRINRGRVEIDEFRRVVGMEVDIDETGIESSVPILEKART
mgnify:CR=1 FL=1